MRADVDVPEIPGVVGLELIARGGTSLVFRGRQEALSRDVAVKVLAPGAATTDSLKRWKRELDAMGRLSNHPNIVAVYDSGVTADARPYLVMPYVPEGTLEDRIRSAGALAADDAIAIGVKIAKALSAAHAAGVLHRDVKPANVLLTPYEPQLADFGIARLTDNSVTNATAVGIVHATINYAAPEVLAGESASESTDVYSLAATLHTALSGEIPFPHGPDANAVAVAQQIINDPVPTLRGVVPDALADVIAAGMAKDPQARPASADAFAEQLEAASATGTVRLPVQPTIPLRESPTPVASAPPTVPEPRLRQRPRVSPRVALLAVSVVALVATVAWLVLARDDPPRAPTSASATTVARDGTVSSARQSRAATADSAVTNAARNYFTRLSTGDYAGAYAMLSPAFRAEQSQASFEGFWRSVSPVSITGRITADGMVARVPIRMRSGGHTYTLSFVSGSDGTLWVDGPRPR